MLSFAAAILFLIATPGPGVLTTAGVGSAFGYRAGLRYVAGLGIGNNIVALAVISGLAAIVLSVPVIRVVLAVLSALYLGYLALRIALSGSRVAFIEAAAAPGLVDGVLLQFINPKAYAVNTTLFANFAFTGMSLGAETAAKLLILNAIWIPIHLLWLYAGVTLHRLELPERWQRRINLAMAAALLLVVALALRSTLGAY